MLTRTAIPREAARKHIREAQAIPLAAAAEVQRGLVRSVPQPAQVAQVVPVEMAISLGKGSSPKACFSTTWLAAAAEVKREVAMGPAEMAVWAEASAVEQESAAVRARLLRAPMSPLPAEVAVAVASARNPAGPSTSVES